MQAQLTAQTSAVEKLLANTRLLESKLAEAKSKKDTLKARAQSAKVGSEGGGGAPPPCCKVGSHRDDRRLARRYVDQLPDRRSAYYRRPGTGVYRRPFLLVLMHPARMRPFSPPPSPPPLGLCQGQRHDWRPVDHQRAVGIRAHGGTCGRVVYIAPF